MLWLLQARVLQRDLTSIQDTGDHTSIWFSATVRVSQIQSWFTVRSHSTLHEVGKAGSCSSQSPQEIWLSLPPSSLSENIWEFREHAEGKYWQSAMQVSCHLLGLGLILVPPASFLVQDLMQNSDFRSCIGRTGVFALCPDDLSSARRSPSRVSPLLMRYVCALE